MNNNNFMKDLVVDMLDLLPELNNEILKHENMTCKNYIEYKNKISLHNKSVNVNFISTGKEMSEGVKFNIAEKIDKLNNIETDYKKIFPERKNPERMNYTELVSMNVDRVTNNEIRDLKNRFK